MLADLHRLAQLREVTELGHQETGDRLVGPLGQDNPCLLGKIVGIQQPVDNHVAAAQAMRPASFEVVFVADVADDLLDEILERHDARRAAVLVDDDREVLVFASHLRQSREHVLAVGQHLDRPHEVSDPTGARRSDSARVVTQVADVHEADDVIVRSADDRVPRVRARCDNLQRLRDRRRRVEELDLGARHQHLAQSPVPSREDFVDQPALVATQRLVRCNEAAQFFFADGFAPRVGVAAEQPHDDVGRQPRAAR